MLEGRAVAVGGTEVDVGGAGVAVNVGGSGVGVAVSIGIFVSVGVAVLVALGSRVGVGSGVGVASKPQPASSTPDNTMPTATNMVRRNAPAERRDIKKDDGSLTRITFPLRMI